MMSEHDHLSHVLYVTSSVPCKGCDAALHILSNESSRVQDAVLVQDVDALRREGVSLPDWLNGTPTLVDVQTRDIFKGSQAVTQLAHATCLLAAQLPARPPKQRPNETATRRDDGYTEEEEEEEGEEEGEEMRGVTTATWQEEGGSVEGVEELHDFEEESVDNGKVTEDHVQSVLKERGLDIPPQSN